MIKTVVLCDDATCENSVEVPVGIIDPILPPNWVTMKVIVTNGATIPDVQVCSMGHLTSGVEFRLSEIQTEAP